MSIPAVLSPVFIAGLWVAACLLLSRTGWSRLAGSFAYTGKFDGKMLGFFTVHINGIRYKRCVSLRYNEQGIYLRMAVPFRLFHQPVFIPWSSWKYGLDKPWFGGPDPMISLSGHKHFFICLREKEMKLLEPYLEMHGRKTER